jgi:hypothetical protein
MKKRKRHGPDAEMADILFQATLRQYAPLTADDIRGLTMGEIRQLWLQRREQMRQAGATLRKTNPGGRPQKADPAAVRAELERRQRVGEPTSHGALAQHFRCSKTTIGRKLKK